MDALGANAPIADTVCETGTTARETKVVFEFENAQGNVSAIPITIYEDERPILNRSDAGNTGDTEDAEELTLSRAFDLAATGQFVAMYGVSIVSGNTFAELQELLEPLRKSIIVSKYVLPHFTADGCIGYYFGYHPISVEVEIVRSDCRKTRVQFSGKCTGGALNEAFIKFIYDNAVNYLKSQRDACADVKVGAKTGSKVDTGKDTQYDSVD